MCDRPCCSPTEILLGILGKEVNFKSVKNAKKKKKKIPRVSKASFLISSIKSKKP